MRKPLLFLTLLGGVFFMLGAGSTASAADCTATTSPIFYNGSKLQFTRVISNCYDVDMVELAPNVGPGNAGINDNSTGVFHFWAPPTLLDVLCGRYNYWFSGSCTHVVHVSLWGCGPVPQSLSGFDNFRIHGYTSHNWGPWHSVQGAPITINC